MKKINSIIIKKHMLKCLSYISPNGKLLFIVSYLHNRHKLPNLKKPKDLSEIWIKKVLDGDIDKNSYLADKYEVRDYVEKCGMANILPKLYGVYTSSEQIDFDILPNKFALKANWGAGQNIICSDKSKLDVDKCRMLIKNWFKKEIYSFSERHYNLIPKKFICEEFIDDGNGGFPIDYKFMCLYGKVHCVLACSGRERGMATYLPYSVDWEPLYEYYRGVKTDIELLSKPHNLDEMIKIAEKLSYSIDLVRVDLYSNGDNIWFGEMTLTPAGCIFHRWSKKALDDMGRVYLRKK